MFIFVTPKCLAVEEHSFYEQLLTIRYLKEAIFSMTDEKSPQCDGFPHEFYKHLWESIVPDLHQVYLEAYHSKSLGAIIKIENIKFIHKAIDHKDI